MSETYEDESDMSDTLKYGYGKSGKGYLRLQEARMTATMLRVIVKGIEWSLQEWKLK